MTPAATINSIDPRDLTRDSMGTLVISIGINFTSPLLVSGNIAVQMINGLLMDGIENRFWRKRLGQQVPSSPTIDSVVFKGPVTGKSINGHQVEDYMNVMDQQMINGTYVFQGLVTVDGNFGFLEGGTVDGVDVSALKDNVVYLQGDQFIDGLMTFSKLKIDHDLKVDGKLNGWNVTSDFMRLDESFPHIGNLIFMNKTTATSVKMTNSDLLVESLNGMVVEDAVADIVLSNEDATINGSLMFKGNVLANHIDVNGTIDGVDLEDLARRSLKKVSGKPQLLTASIKVDGGVSFTSSLKLQVVNNKPWTDHLMKVIPLDYDGVISGKKTFEKNVTILGDFNPALLNRINMSRLVSSILTTNTEQTISSQYFFEGDILAKNVNAPKIDGVDVGALALVDEDGDVPLNLLFEEDVAFLDSVTSTSGFLDGCHILGLNSSVIYFGPNRTLELNGTTALSGIDVMKDVAAKSKVTAGPNATDVFYFLES
ncbi:uncharacterized protein LOC125025063 isoform X2 [Penaeus chinensis]|uniref:uncharacterized protein LOC125025063 isoform X2 n=1 Tax=Penaeus chinensis TaxID=139456 RepID=UPI001FB66DAC|nr:uncharacterized protein LOC125025063 isoform X2 [Penaeus chinensis]